MAESLAEYVMRLRGDRSRDAVSEQAGKRGFPISPSYIRKIENGETINPTLDKIDALAAGLGVTRDDIEEVIDLAAGRAPRRQKRVARVFLQGERPAFETGRFPATPDERALMDEAEARGVSFDAFGVPGFWDRPEDDPDREDAFHHLRRMIQIDKRIRGLDGR